MSKYRVDIDWGCYITGEGHQYTETFDTFISDDIVTAEDWVNATASNNGPDFFKPRYEDEYYCFTSRVYPLDDDGEPLYDDDGNLIDDPISETNYWCYEDDIKALCD